MRYLSVCSGIEAASVAWHPMGWTPVGFSEIEPFPAAVLAHRFPGVPNFGDMTKYKEWPLEPGSIDLLVGGTPCQSFSVAGLRKGLADPRGNLMLVFLGIAERLRPRWVVWENVPGVLSSNGGRDFGSFLGALGELGYGWSYRVLDAQWCRVDGWPKAVPQRRRRVFVVGCLGDGTAPARVLLERESVQRDPAPRGGSGEEASGDAGEGAAGGRWWDGSDIAGTLTKQNANGAQRMPDKGNFGAVVEVAHSLRGEGFNASEDGTGRGTPIVVQEPGVMFRWQNARDGLVADEAAPSVRASAGSSGFHEMNHPVVAQGVDLYNHAMTGDVAATVTAACGGGSTSGPKVIAFKPGQSADARTIGAQEDVACTLEGAGGGNNKQAIAFSSKDHGGDAGEVSPTLRSMGHDASHANGGGQVAVAFPLDLRNATRDPEKVDEQNRQGCGIGTPDDPSPTVDRSVVHGVAVAFQQNTRDEVRLINGDGAIAGALAAEAGMKQQNYLAEVAVAPTLSASNNPSRSPQSAEVTAQIAAVLQASPMVRRLTPRECEKLMGLPPDWALVPYRGKPAKDGPRYRAIGNSMAANCMAWIGRRLDAVDKGMPLP